MSNTVDQGTDEMQCTVNKSVDHTFSGLEEEMVNFVPALTAQLLAVTGLQNLSSVIIFREPEYIF